eukprot:CAMPEP_0202713730 /NCGR_PEP_ID=MMETSP1385-20130828/58509_1 /ASSEMBLY_ACC=CAM_ASM_000861 /TAXON_ID=933848 /ORGANISM="Elphidium margaritaceum" /LENGTH=255 /DNA_ID=CAMNT_0049374185 /DNA_START=72 /DNA_END=839 /DNA_ORIENTATION=-
MVDVYQKWLVRQKICGTADMFSEQTCVTKCTTTPATRECSLWGRKTEKPKELCKKVRVGKNSYRNHCGIDPGLPAATVQECREQNQADYKYCRIEEASVSELDAVVKNDARAACAAFQDAAGKPRTLVEPGFKIGGSKPYFTEEGDWTKILCIGTTGSLDTASHQQYRDEISEQRLFIADHAGYGSVVAYYQPYRYQSYADVVSLYALIAAGIFFLMWCFICCVATGVIAAITSAKRIKTGNRVENYDQENQLGN